MNLPSVTAVIPTRDRPELLAQAVASVLDQDYSGEVRVVVVQDGDGPLPSPPSRRGRLVEVCRNERAPGLAGSRNTGILRSETELVAFCDDDDLWLPAKLSRQVPALLHSDAVVASCGIRVRNVNAGMVTDRIPPAAAITFEDLLRDRHAELHSSTLLTRTAALRGALGLVDEAVPGSFGEDYDLLLRAARIAPIATVQDVLAEVRWHGGSYFFERWAMMQQALEWLLERYPEFQTVPAGYARVAGQIAIASAAQGHRREASHWAGRAFRARPLEPRVPLALAVATRTVTAEQLMGWLNRRGRGL